ncbi:hypothetical protein C8R44DRAFT_754892 [Mycena epipterygia]|nr:hypothetical protein C8R44DRAFT_754892 [Mycena epipterygia]
MSNNINIYAGPIKCPPLLSYAGISSIGTLCRLYMVCNSLQGMDGLAAWGTRGTGGVPNLIQDHTSGDSAWLHHLSMPVPWGMVIPSAYHKWQVWSFPVATIKRSLITGPTTYAYEPQFYLKKTSTGVQAQEHNTRDWSSSKEINKHDLKHTQEHYTSVRALLWARYQNNIPDYQ